MARHEPQPNSVFLFIDPAGGTDWARTVVCLTSITKADTVNAIDASSFCGPNKLPGALDLSSSYEGFLVQDPDAAEISGTDLRILLRNKTTIGWKVAPAVPVQGDEIEFGTGFLSELSATYALNAAGTFSFTISPYGTPTLSIFEGS